MRATIETFSRNQCQATIEFDTGGPVGSDHLVIVQPTTDADDWVINRWFYFDEQEEAYMRNFAEKCMTNTVYREASLAEETDWARVANHYEPRARRLYETLSNYDRSDFPIMNDASRADKDKLESVCRELFEGIRDIIRHGDETHPDELYDALQAKLEAWLAEKYD